MSNLIQAEFVKLRKNKFFSVLTGLSIFGAIGFIILLFLASRDLFYIDFSKGFMILEAQPGREFSTTGLEIFAQSTLNNPQSLLIIFSIFAGFFISNDYGSGAIQNAIASGNSRITIYIAKLITYIIGLYIFLSLFTLISTIGASALFGVGDVTDGNVFFYMIRTYFLYLLQIGSFGAIMAMFAFFVEESGKAITLSIVSFVVILMVIDLLSKYILLFEELFSYTFFYQLYMVFNETISVGDIGKALFAGVSGLVFSLAIGLHFFVRKELK